METNRGPSHRPIPLRILNSNKHKENVMYFLFVGYFLQMMNKVGQFEKPKN
jgi:hypothetical protein